MKKNSPSAAAVKSEQPKPTVDSQQRHNGTKEWEFLVQKTIP